MRDDLMPIYVYQCKDCGAIEEHIQRFSDAPMTECASCHGHLDKQVTTAAFHLKGGGWYKDGYASAKDSGAAEPAAKEGKADGSKSADSSGGASADSAKSGGGSGTAGSSDGSSKKKSGDTSSKKSGGGTKATP